MNFSKLESLFESIKEIINYIEVSKYDKRRNRIFLGNGDKFNYSVPKETIPHLLGINTNYLISTGMFKSRNSYEVMLEMIEKGAYHFHSSKDFNLETMFSPYIFNKVEGFKNNIKINTDETIMVCKYDSQRTYMSNSNNEKFDYMIIKKYEDGKIGILSIVAKDNYFVPMSNQLYNNLDEAFINLEDYLKHQEVTLLTAINFFNVESDYEKMIYLNLQEKITKIKSIKSFKDTFNFSIDMSGDYEYSIGKLNQNKNNRSEDNMLIDTIVSSIIQGKLIDTEIFRNTNLSKIIEAFNDYLCKKALEANNGDINASISESYTKLKNDLEMFKKLLQESDKKVNELENENKELSTTISGLSEENEVLKSKEEAIIKILKPGM